MRTGERQRRWMCAMATVMLGCTLTATAEAKRQVHFVPNSYQFWTSPQHATTQLPEGCSGSSCTPTPAFANILLKGSNFLSCQGGPFALCYYSGPNPTSQGIGCTLTEDGRFANCNCYEIPYGSYFVDINAILNYAVYKKTIKRCRTDGSRCPQMNSAPVCGAINRRHLIPGADLISTFSFDCVPTDGFGQTNCTTASPYAGCMTAPCTRTGTSGIVQCSCPTYTGPYQIGQNDQQCIPPAGEVWSAAYGPNAQPLPDPPTCIPDAPGAAGCPLYTPGTAPPSGVDCKAVCREYQQCKQKGSIQSGYTCDATLCTGQCNDRDLVSAACSGLAGCKLVAIVAAEQAVGCSCCASQLCGCQANPQTNAAIADLNQRQRGRGITPQCDINGTLCGTISAAPRR